MPRAITFLSQGVRCSALLYVPDALPAGHRAAAVAMAHSYSAVKEMFLPAVAERLAAAGFVTLLFDYRFLGESVGEPRGQIFWHEQHEDYRNALTWLSDQATVDPDRLGVWGTSYSGGHVLYLAAFDRRIKAVVAQVPYADDWPSGHADDADAVARFDAFLAQDRRARYTTGVVNYVTVTAPAGQPAIFGDAATYDWFMRGSALAPTWRNQVTVESREKDREYAPGAPVHLIAPTPVLMILAEDDWLRPGGEAAYARAGEPKARLVLPCTHYDVYSDPWAPQAADAAAEWFTQHLGASAPLSLS